MKKLDTKTIAEVISGKEHGTAVVTSFSTDTRTIKPGALFLAISGKNYDAHDFVKTAIANGAAAAIISKECNCTIPYIIVDDTMQAFFKLAAYYRSLFEIPVVGITGNCGKTTTKEMTFLVLSSKYKVHKTDMNLNNVIGMCSTLMSAAKDTTAEVIEMGTDGPGQIEEMSSILKPTVGIITNIGVSHIGNYENGRDGILEEKLKILSGLGKDSPLIINYDNDKLHDAVIDSNNVFKVGIYSNNLDLRAENIRYLKDTTEFTAVVKSEKCEVKLHLSGEHNVYNALSALSAGILCGISLNEGAESISGYYGMENRGDVVEKNGITVIRDCYNASLDSSNAAFNSLNQTASESRKIVVFGDMLEMGDYSEEIHKKVGISAAEHKIDILLTYGKYSEYVNDSAKDSGLSLAFHFDDKNKLIDKLCSIVEPGDTVLFKASNGMHFISLADEFIRRI